MQKEKNWTTKSKKLWSRIITNNVFRKPPEGILPPAYSVEIFPAELNPHLKLCMCAEIFYENYCFSYKTEHCFC